MLKKRVASGVTRFPPFFAKDCDRFFFAGVGNMKGIIERFLYWIPRSLAILLIFFISMFALNILSSHNT